MDHLPLEIWHGIALVDSKTYLILVRTCKRMSYPCGLSIEALKDRFCRIDDTVKFLPNGTAWREETRPPTVITRKNVSLWLYHGYLHRGGNLPALVTGGWVMLYHEYDKTSSHKINYTWYVTECDIIIGKNYLDKHTEKNNNSYTVTGRYKHWIIIN